MWPILSVIFCFDFQKAWNFLFSQDLSVELEAEELVLFKPVSVIFQMIKIELQICDLSERVWGLDLLFDPFLGHFWRNSDLEICDFSRQ
ncbi:TPA: hypothetical protein DEG21_05510 [Patescibacteria group bacterium]|nr:hypothetical protein [Candidatus Gracilibacteria bacterium]HBY75279.1 hypothetical protein [Candidatus Gracilibacteria bacterium]